MKTLLSTLFLLLTALVCSGQHKVLHYTETTGYDHGTRTKSLQMFQSWENQLGYTVTHDNTGSEFSSLSNLLQYDVVVFSNTSGNSGLDATQRANFEAYIDSGGSYLGIHAASDTYRHSSANGSKTGTWDWYAETVAGASVQNSPNHTANNYPGMMTQSTPGHPITTNIPASWSKNEEYYYWENGYLAPGFTELLEVGTTGLASYDVPRMMAHCRNLPGGGRAFYTALGHSGNNYSSDQTFRTLIHDALVWLLPAPQAFPIVEVSVRIQGPLLCWEVSEPATINIEIMIPETRTWQHSVRYHQMKGCHELRGCDPVTVRVHAQSDIDSTEAVSEPLEVEPKPFHRLSYGVLHVDCSMGERFTVTDTTGRTMMTGTATDAGIDLQGLSPGFYTVVVGSNSYTVIR